MNQTRRDVLALLVGTSAGTLALHELGRNQPRDNSFSKTDVQSLLTVANTIYPSEISVSASFIRQYIMRLGETRIRGLRRTVRDLNRESNRVFDAPVREITPSDCNRLLQYLGVDRVRSKVDGTLSERVRFHVVNSLLYALFSNPKGSSILGIENPRGHPGGLGSLLRYQQE